MFEQDFLTTGDIVCLWTPVVDKNLLPGRWYSNDRNVMLVEQVGVAYIIGTKESTILLTHSLLPAAPLQMNVLPVTKIVIFRPNKEILTNSKVTSIPLVLKSSKCKDKRSNLVSLNNII